MSLYIPKNSEIEEFIELTLSDAEKLKQKTTIIIQKNKDKSIADLES